MVSELRGLEDALGPLGGPKISKSIIFSIDSLKEFGTFPDRPISLRGPAARSRNRFECFRTTRKPKSLQIDHFLNRNLKEFGTFSDWPISAARALREYAFPLVRASLRRTRQVGRSQCVVCSNNRQSANWPTAAVWWHRGGCCSGSASRPRRPRRFDRPA